MREKTPRVAIVCAIFFLSGAAALLFENVWFRKAGLVFGNGVWASSLVLASFMAGLALGNALAARWAGLTARPLLTYAAAEVLVGAAGVLLVLALPALPARLAPLLRPFLDRPLVLTPCGWASPSPRSRRSRRPWERRCRSSLTRSQARVPASAPCWDGSTARTPWARWRGRWRARPGSIAAWGVRTTGLLAGGLSLLAAGGAALLARGLPARAAASDPAPAAALLLLDARRLFAAAPVPLDPAVSGFFARSFGG